MYLGEPKPKPQRETAVFISDEIQTLITTWCKENPYTVYADREDVISDEMAEKLLFAKTKEDLQEAKCEIENDIAEDLSDYAWTTANEQFKECVRQIKLNFEDEEEEEHVFYFFREYFEFDTSDYVKTCLRHWSGKVVAVVLDKNGEPFEAPCATDHCTEEWRRLRLKWKRSFNLTTKDADRLVQETMYCGTYLKICGTINLWGLWESESPITKVKLNKQCSIIIHNGGNGSGNCWEPPITVDRWVRARIGIDHPRYGVDAVYGMSGGFWRNEIETK